MLLVTGVSPEVSTGVSPEISTGVSPVIIRQTPPLQELLPTPSPILTTNSITSSTWTSQPDIFCLIHRVSALLLSFGSSIALSVNSSSKKGFCNYSELVCCFVTVVICFIYSMLQVLKHIWKILFSTSLISDKISDYFSFALDLIISYLLISSSSVAADWIKRHTEDDSLRHGAIASVVLSFLTFAVMTFSTLLSGYMLCKRTMW